MKGQIEDKFNSFLYAKRETVLSIVTVLSNLCSFVGFIALIYRFGYNLTYQDVLDWQKFADVLFGLYVGIFLLRLLFDLKRKEFLKSTYIQSSIILFMLLHGLLNLLTGFKLLLFFYDIVGFSDPASAYQKTLGFYLAILVGFDITKLTTLLNKLDLKPATTFILSFVILILGGGLSLMLPAMTTIEGSMPFIDALFTSASASCVTGLAVVDTGTYFTYKGQWVIMLLIQLGGIGIVSFATFFATYLSKGVGIKHQAVIQDFLSSDSLNDAKRLLRKVIYITFICEFLGFIAIYFSWGNDMVFKSWGEKIFHSAFHAISAFCNAGFSLYPKGLMQDYTVSELTGESIYYNVRYMYSLHFVIAIIIILGGIGFTTIEELFSWKNIKTRLTVSWKKWSLGTEIAVKSAIILIVIGTVAFLVFEWSKLTDRTLFQATITAFFQSVVTRTAGFNTMDFGTLETPTILITIMLMFIGTSPGSTGGGLKGTTMFVIIYSTIGSIQGKKRIELRRRTIPEEIVKKSLAIFTFAVCYNFLAIFLLTITQPGVDILKLAFEQVSAFSTVGLTMGITFDLSYWSKWVLIFSMFLGRVGALTLALALSKAVKTNAYKYPDANIMVG